MKQALNKMKHGNAVPLTWVGLQALALLGAPMLAHAGQLIYTPVNPNFGGSPLNGAFLDNEATSNNRFLTPKTSATANSTTSAQQQVIQNLQQAAVNAVLSEVAQQISSGLQNNISGSYNIAGELINFQRVGNVINIQLTDATTGAQTTIQIPVPTF
jgi:curli production assembly/transport component CsgF